MTCNDSNNNLQFISCVNFVNNEIKKYDAKLTANKHRSKFKYVFADQPIGGIVPVYDWPVVEHLVKWKLGADGCELQGGVVGYLDD